MCMVLGGLINLKELKIEFKSNHITDGVLNELSKSLKNFIHLEVLYLNLQDTLILGSYVTEFKSKHQNIDFIRILV